MEIASGAGLLAGYPKLARVVDHLNRFLEEKHPTVFGPDASHPVLPLKRSKVVHDPLWGTVRFSWREMALIDSPIMQRLRDIHQTGLAFHVYPSSRHSRFEHCLGATTIASRVFDALLHRQRREIGDLVKALDQNAERDVEILRLKQELRLAALLHDTGHSLYSHTSERVYEKLQILRDASLELSSFVGKAKGAGEVISFCLVLTPAVDRLLKRAGERLIGEAESDDYEGPIDLVNVALIIVGRAKHPFLQFLGDIVSSGFDADKLDYLLRDARAAGLPLLYDIDRYLYDVRIVKEMLADDQGQIQHLLARIGTAAPARYPANYQTRYPYYDTYRLRLSRRAMNVIEQIMISKMMLFSYIYHHGKVRASEGILERLLNRCLIAWRNSGESDEFILSRFIEMTDSALYHLAAGETVDQLTTAYAYRLVNRLVPREVYNVSGPSATHAQKVMIEPLLDVHDRKRRNEVVSRLEYAIGEELLKLKPELGSNPEEAAATAGVWVDAPKPPDFEGVDEMVMGTQGSTPAGPVMQIFPIREWIQAYEHYRYQVRIFAFSEYWDIAKVAGRKAMEHILEIYSDEFYRGIERQR